MRSACIANFCQAGGFLALSNLLEEQAEAISSADAAKENAEVFDASLGNILVQAVSEVNIRPFAVKQGVSLQFAIST